MAGNSPVAYKDRAGRETRSDVVNSSMFVIGSMLISLSILYQPFHQLLFSGGTVTDN